MRVIQILAHSPTGPSEREALGQDWHLKLARQLKRADPAIEVECWRPSVFIRQAREAELAGIPVRLFPAKSIPPTTGRPKWGERSRALLEALRSIERSSETIVHIHGLHNFICYQIAFVAAGSFPVVAQHHGDASPLVYLGGRAGPLLLLSELLDRIALARLDHVYVIDEREQRYLERRHKRRVPVELQGMGVSFDALVRVPRDEARSRLGAGDGTVLALHVGTFDDAKGLLSIARAVHSDVAAPRIQLIAAGGSLDSPAARELAALGVMLFGRISAAELSKLYAASDVCFLLPDPARYFGGIGIAPLEALWFGVPVVSSTLRFAARWSDHPYLGVQVEVLSGVVQALRSAAAAGRDGRRTSYVEEFYSWDKIAASTLRRYESLLGNS